MAAIYVLFAALAIVAGALLGLGIAPVLFAAFMLVAGLGLGWLLNPRRPWWGEGAARAAARPVSLRPYRGKLAIAMFVVDALLFFGTTQIVLRMASA